MSNMWQDTSANYTQSVCHVKFKVKWIHSRLAWANDLNIDTECFSDSRSVQALNPFRFHGRLHNLLPLCGCMTCYASSCKGLHALHLQRPVFPKHIIGCVRKLKNWHVVTEEHCIRTVITYMYCEEYTTRNRTWLLVLALQNVCRLTQVPWERYTAAQPSGHTTKILTVE